MMNKNPHLIDFLKSSGMRQSALAAALGVARSFVCDIVAGRKRPSLSKALQIERISDGAVPVSSWVGEATE